MKISKLLLAVVAATVLLGAFVSSASAGTFSVSALRQAILWREIRFSGGFGEVRCEMLLSGSLHQRTFRKIVNSLIGYITEGTVLRCSQGGATINQASFPWHRSYRSFAGTLPAITTRSETVIGAEWSVREPLFGITCTVRRAESGSVILTQTLTSGVISRMEVSSTGARCEGIEGLLTGSETNVVENLTTRAKITVTLI